MSELHVLIVESPNKVAKIQSYLNNVPGKKFKVTSSKGHIRNMDPKCLSIDVNNNFKPTYLVTPDKKSVWKELQSSGVDLINTDNLKGFFDFIRSQK